MDRLKRFIPKSFQPYIRPAYRSVRKHLEQIDRSIDKRTLSEAEFESLLQRLGFNPGAVIFVHSSMNELSRRVPALSPMKVLQIMQQLVGTSGTLLLPTFPFQGLQLRYVETHDRFDTRRTPSQAGLITEVFRRLPGVVRSIHPTHPVAAWGKHATALTEDHHRGETFGPNSPICKIREYDGIVAGLGIGIEKFTIAHVPEELHPKARTYCFEPVRRKMTIMDGDHIFDYEFRCLRAGVDRVYRPVESALVRDGILRNVVAGGLRCATADAGLYIRRSMELLDANQYLFNLTS